MAEVKVKLFAILQDRFGSDSITVDVGPGLTAAELLDRVREEYPDHARQLAVCRVAVNRRFAVGMEKVGPDDEVALIPPVSGG